MPFALEAFSTLGDVRLMSGRKMSPADVRGADLLVVRSITKVNEALLAGSRVRFVGTATIGTDHVDLPYLERRGIAFSAAPGCNANSVSEWFAGSLLEMAARKGFSLEGKSLGIVGVGNVGSRVEQKALALGMKVVRNDPPLAEKTGDPKYRPLEEALAANVVTMHVPLEKGGRHPTFHLAGRAFFERLGRGKGFVNAGRGASVDEPALRDALRQGRLLFSVLDVFEGEPAISAETVLLADLVSPHVAGYSFEGKVNGTSQIYAAACRHLGATPSWDPASVLGEKRSLPFAPTGNLLADLLAVVRSSHDVRDDDRDLRAAVGSPEPGPAFDALRKNYRKRREFSNTMVRILKPDARLAAILRALGFGVEEPAAGGRAP